MCLRHFSVKIAPFELLCYFKFGLSSINLLMNFFFVLDRFQEAHYYVGSLIMESPCTVIFKQLFDGPVPMTIKKSKISVESRLLIV